MNDSVEFEKDVTALVTRTRYTVKFKTNVTCKSIKSVLDRVPDNAVLTLIYVDSGTDEITELYFDVETDY